VAPTSAPAALVITCEQFETEAAQVATIEVAAGAPFTVTLCSNPSTGYVWAEPTIADPAIVRLDGAIDAAAASPMPGAPGDRIHTFTGIAAGQTTIAFGYAGPAPSVAPEWTLELTVSVR
jgi:predicted secreted protein